MLGGRSPRGSTSCPPAWGWLGPRPQLLEMRHPGPAPGPPSGETTPGPQAILGGQESRRNQDPRPGWAQGRRRGARAWPSLAGVGGAAALSWSLKSPSEAFGYTPFFVQFQSEFATGRDTAALEVSAVFKAAACDDRPAAGEPGLEQGNGRPAVRGAEGEGPPEHNSTRGEVSCGRRPPPEPSLTLADPHPSGARSIRVWVLSPCSAPKP